MNSDNQVELQKEKNKLQVYLIGADIIKALIRCCAAVAIFYFGFDALKTFAGKISIADIEFLSTIKINKWVPLAIGILVGYSGFQYGFRQKKLRKEYIDRYTDRIQKLEKQIDPNRSSSGLTSTGDSHPED